MAASDPDTNMEGDFVGQATKDNPALASVDASNPTRYKITVLMSHAGAQRGSDNTIMEVPLCRDGARACTLSSVLTRTTKFRVLDLHGADNGLDTACGCLTPQGRTTSNWQRPRGGRTGTRRRRVCGCRL